MELTIKEIAERIGGRVVGDAAATIRSIAGLRDAGPGQATFLGNARYAPLLESTQATAVIVPESFSSPRGDLNLLLCANPSLAFSKLALLFAPAPVKPAPGVHPTAVVAPGVKLGRDVTVGAYAVVEAGAVIGDRTVLYPYVYVGQETVLGADSLIYSHVSIRERVQIGDRVIVHCNSVIGSDGFGYDTTPDGIHHKIPQIGTVVIEDDVEIGSCVTIDRARFDRTWIQKGTKIDNLVQIAHNVVVGRNAIIVSQCGISGSTEIGEGAILAGQAGLAGHLKIGDHAVVGAKTGVAQDVPANQCYMGIPARPNLNWKKEVFALTRLPEALRELRQLRQKIEKLEQQLPQTRPAAPEQTAP